MSQNSRKNRFFQGKEHVPDSTCRGIGVPRDDFASTCHVSGVLSTLEQVRETVIRETFGKDVNPEEYTLMDCLKEYKKRANERKRFARDELLLFKNAIEVWEAEKENVDKLILEKRRFRKALERYADEMHGEVLFNLDYSYYRIDSFIDAALILPNAVLLLNLRVPNHDSAVDQDGNLCWFDPYSSKLVKENIRIELFKQELMVRMMLSSAGLESFRVLTSLIVGGDEYLFVNHNTDDVNSGRLGSLEKSLTLEHSTCFTKDEQSIVTKKLWEEKSNFDGSDLSYESDLLDAFRKLQAKV